MKKYKQQPRATDYIKHYLLSQIKLLHSHLRNSLANQMRPQLPKGTTPQILSIITTKRKGFYRFLFCKLRCDQNSYFSWNPRCVTRHIGWTTQIFIMLRIKKSSVKKNKLLFQHMALTNIINCSSIYVNKAVRKGGTPELMREYNTVCTVRRTLWLL